jgi:hypothetical protein
MIAIGSHIHVRHLLHLHVRHHSHAHHRKHIAHRHIRTRTGAVLTINRIVTTTTAGPGVGLLINVLG